MNDFVKVFQTDEWIHVCFYIEHDEILAIGEKMNEIEEAAYMNGYNWEAFFNYYLEKNAPELLEGMKSDPEAGMYAAYYKITPENRQKADTFRKMIVRLISDEQELYEILREHGQEIEWD